jgi:glucose-1-phosphate thymidylyltransferase
VLIAQDFLGDDDFVMYLGDNFIIGGITELVQEFREGSYDAQILLTKVDNPSQFGVAELGPHGGVTTLVEKPKEPKSDLALVGVYMFRPGHPRRGARHQALAAGELEITDALQWLIDEGRDVRPHLVTGYWKDTGRLEDMLECNRKVLESLEPASTARSTPTRCSPAASSSRRAPSSSAPPSAGPAIIGRDTVVRDTYVGPVHLHLLRLHARGHRDRALDRARGVHDPRRRPHRGQPDRQAGRGVAVQRAAAGATG